MKNSLKLALGAIAGVFAASGALAQDYHGHPDGHPSAPPQGGHPQYSAPHFSQPSHPQVYRPAPNFSGRAYQPSHSYAPDRGPSAPVYHGQTYQRGPSYGGSYRGSTYHGQGYQGRGYAAPGAATRGFDHSRVSSVGREHAAAFHTFQSFRGRNVSMLGAHEREMWRGGAWRHSWHNGRYGWWWFVDGGWFFYDTPVYPYPVYISDYAYYDYDDADDGGYGTDTNYWCSWPQGYYPDVQWCSVPWQPVPAY